MTFRFFAFGSTWLFLTSKILLTCFWSFWFNFGGKILSWCFFDGMKKMIFNKSYQIQSKSIEIWGTKLDLIGQPSPPPQKKSFTFQNKLAMSLFQAAHLVHKIDFYLTAFLIIFRWNTKLVFVIFLNKRQEFTATMPSILRIIFHFIDMCFSRRKERVWIWMFVKMQDMNFQKLFKNSWIQTSGK